MGLGFEVSLENQKVVNMCTLSLSVADSFVY